MKHKDKVNKKVLSVGTPFHHPTYHEKNIETANSNRSLRRCKRSK